MKHSLAILAGAIALASTAAHADIYEKRYAATASGNLTITVSGACSGKIVYGPETTQQLQYGWQHSATDNNSASASDKNPGNQNGMFRNEQAGNFQVTFPALQQQMGTPPYDYLFGGLIGGSTSNTVGKASLSVSNNSSSETVKVSGTGFMTLEKALTDAVSNNHITCKNGESLTDLLSSSDQDEFYAGQYFRAFNGKTTASLVHKASAPNYNQGNYTIKLTSSYDLDVAEVCSGKMASGNWAPSNANIGNPSSLSCKAGPAIKVKVSYTASGTSNAVQIIY